MIDMMSADTARRLCWENKQRVFDEMLSECKRHITAQVDESIFYVGFQIAGSTAIWNEVGDYLQALGFKVKFMSNNSFICINWESA